MKLGAIATKLDLLPPFPLAHRRQILGGRKKAAAEKISAKLNEFQANIVGSGL